jgi:hypothetical protein
MIIPDRRAMIATVISISKRVKPLFLFMVILYHYFYMQDKNVDK